MKYPQQLSGISYKAWGLVAILALILTFFLFYSKTEAKVTIYKNNEPVRMFEGEVVSKMTVLDALVAASKAGNFEFNYSVEESELRINKFDTFIDGLGSDIKINVNGEEFKYNESFTKTISPGDKIDIFI